MWSERACSNVGVSQKGGGGGRGIYSDYKGIMGVLYAKVYTDDFERCPYVLGPLGWESHADNTHTLIRSH